MKFKGTKGEWTHSEMKGQPNNCFLAQVFDSEGKSLASLNSRYGEEISTANAKLIAASPILLEALLQFIDPLTGLVYDSLAHEIGKKAAFKIEEAIRKAL